VTRIAIIGAGYAGMAAAVTLSAAGHTVSVFESSRVLGGRARKVEFGGAHIDNGQHILIGAYRDTLQLMQQVGINPDQALLRLPLTLHYPEFKLHAPKLPTPLHLALALLTAHGLNWSEKWAAIRFMQWLKQQRFTLPADSTVTALLDAHAQPQQLRRYLWEPLCISALNTPADQASAQVFANVLRDSLAAAREASDLLIPRINLSALFPEAAANFVQTHGGALHMRTAISQIQHYNQGFVLEADAEGDTDDNTAAEQRYSHVIAAVGPHHLPRLLTALPSLAPVCAQVEALHWEPIVTCYLRYSAGTRLPQPMLGLCNGYVHWVFDRGQLDGNDGLFAAVISARGAHSDLTREALANAVHLELKALLPALPEPLDSQVITEKRATFACTPNLSRPTSRTPLPGLLLAGDYVASDYPATIESAVRSGIAAAQAVING